MRGVPYIINIFIFMIAFNAISFVLMVLFAFALDFALELLGINYSEIQSYAKPTGMVFIVVWFGLGLLLSHFASVSASYEDRDFEDSIKDALSQLKMYVSLCFPFGK